MDMHFNQQEQYNDEHYTEVEIIEHTQICVDGGDFDQENIIKDILEGMEHRPPITPIPVERVRELVQQTIAAHSTSAVESPEPATVISSKPEQQPKAYPLPA